VAISEQLPIPTPEPSPPPMPGLPPLAEERRKAPPAVRSRWPVFEADEIDAVAEVLRSGRVNALQHGERCREFERRFATLCDAPHAIALANGTLALELALRALGIGAGDEVVVTPRSFVASASCVLSCGATPVFADVDPDSQNLTPESVSAVLSPRTRAVILVHLAGWPCRMEEFQALARQRGFKIIEDCAQALGAACSGRPVGSFGDAAAFSFCTDKIVSTGGEGGMLLLREEADWRRAWSYKDHGKDYGAFAKPAPTTRFRWLHSGFGSNYRMTEMQAAIGLRQLAKLPAWLAVRRRNAHLLDDGFTRLPAIRTTRPPEDIHHAYYKHYAFVRPDRLKPGWSRDRIVAAAAARGAPCFVGVCPEIYREKAFACARLGPPRPLPVAQQLGATSLMLPVDPTLDIGDMLSLSQIVAETVAEASA
jgi:dTDP-4-amino-4,6-dideoxygalactose transaminase